MCATSQPRTRSPMPAVSSFSNASGRPPPSITALQRLNALGYGDPQSGLQLNLVYNPQGPSLPPPQATLEADYRRVLGEQYGVRFDRLLELLTAVRERTTLVGTSLLEYVPGPTPRLDLIRRILAALEPGALA